MKKCYLLFALTLASAVGFSQIKKVTPHKTYMNEHQQKVEVYLPTSFSISKPLRELAKAERNKPTHKNGEKRFVKNNFRRNKVTNHNALPQGDDPIWQKNQGTRTSKAPLASFDGIPPGNSLPLDPSGAASATHYVQAINTAYRVYDKSGTALIPATNLSALWSGTADDGDPIVLYDKYADRWFISQFQSNAPYQLLVAISQTNDPTGSYYTYSFSFSSMPDYPKYSIWWDGYYFSINGSDGTSGVLEREKMLTGDPTAQMQVLTALDNQSNGFVSMLPTDADGSLPPNGSPCYFFNLNDDLFGTSVDGIQVFKMTTDWATPANTVLVADSLIVTSAFDTDFAAATASNDYPHISQKGTSFKLDAIMGVVYYRAQHRVWSGYNSVVLCHVVDVDGNDRGGMRWYELRQVGSGDWTLYQEGTYAPNSDTDNRWLGSIAMDDQGNIALAYNASGPNTFPSIRYTGRKASDPLGQMTFTEETAIAGLGFQDEFTGGDRYGDYSHLCLDPDGTTFWHTAEYVMADGFPTTRIYSFELATTTGRIDNPFYKDLATKIVATSEAISIDVDGLKDNSMLTLDVFDITGKLMLHFDVNPNNNHFEKLISTTSFSKGIYLVRFGNLNFQVVEKVAISN